MKTGVFNKFPQRHLKKKVLLPTDPKKFGGVTGNTTYFFLRLSKSHAYTLLSTEANLQFERVTSHYIYNRLNCIFLTIFLHFPFTEKKLPQKIIKILSNENYNMMFIQIKSVYAKINLI